MVVEDHDDTRFLFKWALEAGGYRVVEAADGLKAVELAVRERPDLILIDGTLPSLDGLTAARRILEEFAPTAVPILALSGHGTECFAAEARASGCASVLLKPVTIETLLEHVKKLLPQTA